MGIKIGDTREIELLDSIKNEDAINFEVGNKFIELTEDILKTNGSPLLKFTNTSNIEYYIREYFTAEQGLSLYLNAEDLLGGQTTWVDKSGNGHNFSLHNFSCTSTSGYNPVDKSLNADGNNDYCYGPINIDFGTGDFTIEIYFKKMNGSVYQYDTLISKGTYDRTSHWYIYQNSTNINEWTFRSKSSDFKFAADAVGKYCHVIIGRENDIMFARINGEVFTSYEDEISGNNLNLTNSENLALFSRDKGRERYFNGGIKIVRFYNRALTLEESISNYEEILHNEEV